MRCRHILAAALISTGLCGCGIGVPQVGEFWDRDYPGDGNPHGTPPLNATAQIEFEIKQKVYCELKHAVQAAEAVDAGDENGKKRMFIPYGWGVQMQLSLGVDETIALTPGLSLTKLYPNAVTAFGVGNSVTTPQSFNLGLGGSLSREVIRTDKFNTYYSIKDLALKKSYLCDKDGKVKPEEDLFNNLGQPAAMSSPFLIESSLGLKDWLIGAMYFDTVIPSASAPQPQSPSPSNDAKFKGKFTGKLNGAVTGEAEGTFEGETTSGGSSGSKKGGSKAGAAGGGGGGAGGFNQDSVSIEIKFIIITSGNVQPTWKLVQVSANTGGTPFFSSGRTRTHDLILTIGPPTSRTAGDFLASQIGQATRR